MHQCRSILLLRDLILQSDPNFVTFTWMPIVSLHYLNWFVCNSITLLRWPYLVELCVILHCAYWFYTAEASTPFKWWVTGSRKVAGQGQRAQGVEDECTKWVYCIWEWGGLEIIGRTNSWMKLFSYNQTSLEIFISIFMFSYEHHCCFCCKAQWARSRVSAVGFLTTLHVAWDLPSLCSLHYASWFIMALLTMCSKRASAATPRN